MAIIVRSSLCSAPSAKRRTASVIPSRRLRASRKPDPRATCRCASEEKRLLPWEGCSSFSIFSEKRGIVFCHPFFAFLLSFNLLRTTVSAVYHCLQPPVHDPHRISRRPPAAAPHSPRSATTARSSGSGHPFFVSFSLSTISTMTPGAFSSGHSVYHYLSVHYDLQPDNNAARRASPASPAHSSPG